MSLKKILEDTYSCAKYLIYELTPNPEDAHHFMAHSTRLAESLAISKLLKDKNSTNYKIPISNAAGFNKNADISIDILSNYFNRVVIGTVTAQKYSGNPDPIRIIRYPHTHSMINWLGLPGIGAKAIANRLKKLKNPNKTKLTINIMATPNQNISQSKKLDYILEDLKSTILLTRDCPNVDRFELNESCPNTPNSSGGLDQRKEYQKNKYDRFKEVKSMLRPNQELFIKVSPDLNIYEAESTWQAMQDLDLYNLTLTNTTTKHNKLYILNSPKKGGASGDALWTKSLNVQKMFNEISKGEAYMIAVGGIRDKLRLKERINNNAKEAQLYTPLITIGPQVLREFLK